jgi:hypothetical protein
MRGAWRCRCRQSSEADVDRLGVVLALRGVPASVYSGLVARIGISYSSSSFFAGAPVAVAVAARQYVATNFRKMGHLAAGRAATWKIAAGWQVATGRHVTSVAIEEAALTPERAEGGLLTLGLVMAVDKAAFVQPFIEQTDAAPNAVATYCPVAQRGATAVPGDRCVGAAKSLVRRKEALIKADCAERNELHHCGRV